METEEVEKGLAEPAGISILWVVPGIHQAWTLLQFLTSVRSACML